MNRYNRTGDAVGGTLGKNGKPKTKFRVLRDYMNHANEILEEQQKSIHCSLKTVGFW